MLRVTGRSLAAAGVASSQANVAGNQSISTVCRPLTASRPDQSEIPKVGKVTREDKRAMLKFIVVVGGVAGAVTKRESIKAAVKNFFAEGKGPKKSEEAVVANEKSEVVNAAPSQEEQEVVSEAPKQEPEVVASVQEEPEVVNAAPKQEPEVVASVQEEPEVVNAAPKQEPEVVASVQEEPEVVNAAPSQEETDRNFYVGLVISAVLAAATITIGGLVTNVALKAIRF